MTIEFTVTDHETALWQTYTTDRTIENRNALVEYYIPYMESLARIYMRKYARAREAAEIKSMASIGLIQAVERFDPGHGFKFTSYAYARIMGAITDQIRAESPYCTRYIPRLRRGAIWAATFVKKDAARLDDVEAELPPSRVDIERDVLKQLDVDYVQHLISRLRNFGKWNLRDLMRKYVVDGMLMREIGAETGVTYGAISIIIKEARRRMRKMIEMDRLKAKKERL